MENKLVFKKKIYLKLPVLTFDILAIPIAWYLAYWLRYNMTPMPAALFSHNSLVALGILSTIQIASYYHFKVYRGLWQFSSMEDVARIIRAVFYTTILVIPVLYASSLLVLIPRSILPLYALSLATLLCAGRMTFRRYSDRQEKINDSADELKRVIIVGAGQAGESLVRELKRTQSYVPVGLVDDDINKRGLEVHRVRVLGTISDLTTLVTQHKVHLIFIAIPSANSVAMRRIVNYCELCKIPFRTLPGIQALVSGNVKINALRDVNLEDLLGRDPIELSWDKITARIQGKRILVTGGGGSIGSELCRQIMKLAPEKLFILDNNEYNLYKIDLELREIFPNNPAVLGLASVTDTVAIKNIFHTFRPHIVFHAAAYKHVPMLESQLRVAVTNNILGTQIVAEASAAFNAEQFVLISTDKAVNPTNIMGTTKRIGEIFCQNLNTHVTTRFITVRFGNVLGSVGSVVPLFQKQLHQGGPLTVTHPEIQRFFMTIAEACQLILQAMVNGNGGEIFVLDMGEPVKIRYLAEQMIRLAGKEPNKDIMIQYTGLRPGEKLYEELFHDAEQLEATEHEKLFKAKVRQIDWTELTQAMKMLSQACGLNQQDELLILLKSLVPEFRSDMIPATLEVV